MRALRSGLVLAVLASAAAHAQVTLNPGALDLLPDKSGPAKPVPHAARPAAAHPASNRRTPAATAGAAKPAPPAPSAPAAAAAGPPAKPTLPTVAPAVAALPPPAPVPPPRPQPAPVVPVAADAAGAAAPEGGGVRVTFGKDSSELNPGTEAALRSLADRLKPGDATINIYAYAAGVPDDPSTPRRLALARALAARAVLITQGIPSTRIYPRALGPTGGDADPDRVDVVPGPVGPPASAAPPIQQPASPPAPGAGAK